MIAEEEIWSRIDAIGREVVEEQKSMRAGLWVNLALLQEGSGKPKEALSSYRNAYEQAVLAGDKGLLFESSLGQGALLINDGRKAEGAKRLEHARRLAEGLDVRARLRVALAMVGEAQGLSRLADRVEELVSGSAKARPVNRGLGLFSRRSPPSQALSEELRGTLGACAGRLVELAPFAAGQRQEIERMIAAFAALGLEAEAGRLALTLGASSETAPLALSPLERAVELFEAAGEQRGEAAAHYRLARALIVMGSAEDHRLARRHLQKAEALCEEMGLKEGVAAARRALSELEGDG